jgi:hypothetical protein
LAMSDYPIPRTASGPVPLSDIETRDFLKSLRRRLLVNGLKVAWKENRGFMVFLMVMLFVVPGMFFLLITADTEPEDEEEDGTGDEEDDLEDEPFIFVAFMVGGIGLVVYMMLMLGMNHAIANVAKLSGHVVGICDRDFLYASLLDRRGVVGFNIRVLARGALLYSLAIFVIGILALSEEGAMEYLPHLVFYCVYNFLLGFLLLFVNTEAEVYRRAQTVAAGGIHVGSIRRSTFQLFAGFLTVLGPAMLLLFVFFPLAGVAVVVALVPVYRRWRERVLPDYIRNWHEDVVRIYIPPAPGETVTQAQTRWGGEGREMPEVKKWYHRGIFDKKSYVMEENGHGYGALVEKSKVVNQRNNSNLHIHTAKFLAVLCVLVSVLLFPDTLAIAATFLVFYSLAALILFFGMYPGIPFHEGKHHFELMYLLPVSGRELIMGAFRRTARLIFLLMLPVIAFFLLLGNDWSSPVVVMIILLVFVFLFLNASNPRNRRPLSPCPQAIARGLP